MPTRTPVRSSGSASGRFGRTATSGRFPRPTGRTSTSTGRFARMPGRNKPAPKKGFAAFAAKLPSSGRSRPSSRRGPAYAALAGIGGVAAAFAKRRRSGRDEPPAPGV